MGRVRIHVQASCCKWDGTTQLLNLFTSNDLATCAVMSDSNEDVRGVLRLPVNPLEIIIARESSRRARSGKLSCKHEEGIVWLISSDPFRGTALWRTTAGPPSWQAVGISTLKYYVVHRVCEELKSNGFSDFRGKYVNSGQTRGKSQPPSWRGNKKHRLFCKGVLHSLFSMLFSVAWLFRPLVTCGKDRKHIK